MCEFCETDLHKCNLQGERDDCSSPLHLGIDMKFTSPPPNMNMYPPDADFHDKFSAMSLGGHHRSTYSPLKVGHVYHRKTAAIM